MDIQLDGKHLWGVTLPEIKESSRLKGGVYLAYRQRTFRDESRPGFSLAHLVSIGLPSSEFTVCSTLSLHRHIYIYIQYIHS